MTSDATKIEAIVRQPLLSDSEGGPDLKSGPISTDLRTLHKRIIDLATGIDSINIQTFEELTPKDIRTEFAPFVVANLQTALSLTRELLEEFDETSSSNSTTVTCFSGEKRQPSSAELRESFNVELEKLVDVVTDNSLSTDALSFQKLADIAFISNLELTEHSRRLGQLRSEMTSWELIATYSSALRGITKTMAAISLFFVTSTVVLNVSTSKHDSNTRNGHAEPTYSCAEPS